MNLRPDTILKRTNEIELRLNSLHSIDIIIKNNRQSISNHALMILNVFAHPLSLQDGLKKLQANGSQDWMELTDTINKLYLLGALSKDSENQFLSDKSSSSFGSAPIHIAMLNDKIRTESFIHAIHEIVKEGDVVVDIGTGTGVLAIAAARAGAKKVYAIEAGAMADVAQAVINNTEVSEKITVIRGWSTQVELPEKADILVSEIIGDDPFAERVLQTFKDARQRLLKPNARILPGKMKVLGIPVEIPDSMLQSRVLQNEYLENWKNWYHIDFSALKSMAINKSEPLFKLSAKNVKDINILGEPLLLTETDFQTFQELRIENLVSAQKEENFNGLLVYFTLGLGETIELTNHPQSDSRANHWLNPIWYFPQVEKIKTGDDFTLQFTYGEGKNSEICIL